MRRLFSLVIFISLFNISNAQIGIFPGFQGFIAKANSTSFDTDANAFFSATAISQSGLKNAINTLVVSAKAHSWWTNAKIIYPLVCDNTGGTNADRLDQMKYNLKTSLNTNAGFRLDWQPSTGSITAATNGLTFVSPSWANTFLKPRTDIASGSGVTHAMALYSATNTAAFGYDAGTNDFISGVVSFYMAFGTNDGFLAGDANDPDFTITPLADARGFYIMARTSSTALKVYKNGTAIDPGGTWTMNANGLPNQELFLGNLRNGGSGSSTGSSKRIVFMLVYNGAIDATLQATITTDVNQFQNDVEAAFSLPANSRKTF